MTRDLSLYPKPTKIFCIFLNFPNIANKSFLTLPSFKLCDTSTTNRAFIIYYILVLYNVHVAGELHCHCTANLGLVSIKYKTPY
jgi:hypothetical protein